MLIESKGTQLKFFEGQTGVILDSLIIVRPAANHEKVVGAARKVVQNTQVQARLHF